MSPQAWIALATAVAVLMATATGLTQFTAAALLGASLVIFTGVISLPEAASSVAQAQGTLTLLFGMMVVVQALEATGAFPVLAHRLMKASQGEGRRLLLGLVLLTSAICAWLPNAATVLLIGPLLPPLARELDLDPRPLLILLVLTANSAGLLTVIGDPATYLVASQIGLGFLAYGQQVASAGALSLLMVLLTLPWLYRSTWRLRLPALQLEAPRLLHPWAFTLLLLVVLVMLPLFLWGEGLPIPLRPEGTALAGATVSLVVVQRSRMISVERLLSRLDWSTLLYFIGLFVLIGALEKQGVLASGASLLSALISSSSSAGAQLLLLGTASASAVVPNIPLVATLTPVLLESSSQAGLLGAGGTVPEALLPSFIALMLGGTLGGNATLIGASANLVAAGIASQEGCPISFRQWLNFGVPTVLLQLAASALWLHQWQPPAG
ncbi:MULTISPECIES: SLC13 family permease [unclassified Synechococcus]|uniref:SLC13 family permease n=1 Tax=unclassified Synechococcus TaxID=2626047 RepID=UPI0000698962|nr:MULTISPECIES: SLC13 family permease [unclassified Synechococcus]EAQ74905.1 probable transport protein [Synechococcus sp. WH 5701]WFN58287.1 SLC13 family permease [Synechococcus sp. CCFWC 502]